MDPDPGGQLITDPPDPEHWNFYSLLKNMYTYSYTGLYNLFLSITQASTKKKKNQETKTKHNVFWDPCEFHIKALLV
jgi:hypothetical protein